MKAFRKKKNRRYIKRIVGCVIYRRAEYRRSDVFFTIFFSVSYMYIYSYYTLRHNTRSYTPHIILWDRISVPENSVAARSPFRCRRRVVRHAIYSVLRGRGGRLVKALGVHIIIIIPTCDVISVVFKSVNKIYNATVNSNFIQS